MGDEGGFAPAVSSNRQPLELIVEAISKAGYRPRRYRYLHGPASSEFYVVGNIPCSTENTRLSADEMTRY